MKYEELLERYQPAMNALLAALGEAGGQVLQEKIEIYPGEPGPLSEDFTAEHEYPLLKVGMESSAAGKYNHSFLMDKSMAGLIFSWMGGVEVPEEIGDEQLNAVKEAASQIISQLQAGQEGEEQAFTAGEIELIEVASQEELDLPGEGLLSAYHFTRGDEETEYHITHIVDGEVPSEEAGEAPAEEAEEGSEAEEAPVEEGESIETAVEGAEADEEAVAEEAPEGEAAEMDEEMAEEEPVEFAPTGEEELGDEEDIAALFGDAADEGAVVEVSPAEFDEFIEAAPGDGKGRKINLLLDVELDVSVELGRKIMIVDDILRLGKGSVIELNKLAGEPVDVLVNGKKLAEGEVVVVEDHFGVRLTHLLDPKERIKSLGR